MVGGDQMTEQKKIVVSYFNKEVELLTKGIYETNISESTIEINQIMNEHIEQLESKTKDYFEQMYQKELNDQKSDIGKLHVALINNNKEQITNALLHWFKKLQVEDIMMQYEQAALIQSPLLRLATVLIENGHMDESWLVYPYYKQHDMIVKSLKPEVLVVKLTSVKVFLFVFNTLFLKDTFRWLYNQNEVIRVGTGDELKTLFQQEKTKGQQNNKRKMTFVSAVLIGAAIVRYGLVQARVNLNNQIHDPKPVLTEEQTKAVEQASKQSSQNYSSSTLNLIASTFLISYVNGQNEKTYEGVDLSILDQYVGDKIEIDDAVCEGEQCYIVFRSKTDANKSNQLVYQVSSSQFTLIRVE